jgi:hypothetical protein
MIKIGNEKLFTMTELLENLVEDIKTSELDAEVVEIAFITVGNIIGESADFVRGFVTSRREG